MNKIDKNRYRFDPHCYAMIRMFEEIDKHIKKGLENRLFFQSEMITEKKRINKDFSGI